ncbi:L-psp endoribonuclease family protein [Grosmannia clavigera kw1407]|uniref:L-psp endoribonuclease family protein n=1 Tax=Grosmannia clavigera (strain kw1407 / UAMH 11150) TaxID=655863 RepID=F0XQC7_GROCL|nr:L-psp endoribonuclease family protein [Grosmannia clavigera kw1407]EFX00749.1 L-psp endoribonuclease family protein [Grosmannia clavigera kw1407]
MSRKAVLTTDAPPPLPQFSQAIKCNGMIYCSGNIGVDPATNKLVDGGIKAETRMALGNLSAVLRAGGASLADVVKVNVFLTTMDDFQHLNEAYDEAFCNTVPKPCRTAIAVYQLPLGAKVEIECSAILPPQAKI